MDTLDEQKIIALLSIGDLNNKKLAFQLIEYNATKILIKKNKF